jgi:hypothetical protein
MVASSRGTQQFMLMLLALVAFSIGMVSESSHASSVIDLSTKTICSSILALPRL